jgi:hypothetical protein
VFAIQLLMQLFGVGADLLWHTNGPAATLAIVGLVGAIGLATFAIAACTHYVIALAASLTAQAQARRVPEPANAARLLSQSDPDADGRARPRAPSLFLAAA